MFNELIEVKRKRRKAKRLPVAEKRLHIINMMEKNTDYHYGTFGHRGVGYRMSQIADMAGYSPSTALMNDLWSMVDERMLFFTSKRLRGNPIAPYEYVFFTPLSWENRSRQRRLQGVD
ncbi:MAG: hypothetical protein ABJA62_07655 [Luteimonas sp.]